MKCFFCDANTCDSCGACENCRKFHHRPSMIVEDKQRLIEIFDAMLKKLDELPIHAKNSFVTNRDLYAFLSLISSILKE